MTPNAPAAHCENRRESPRWLRLIVDHNPFYLLSAISMLLGCYLLNTALYTPAGDIGKLLVLLAVVNLYELLILPLGIVLVQREWPVKRDGATLLILEALFLSGVTFTCGTIATVDAGQGLLIALAVLLLAAFKLWFIFRTLHIPKGPRVCLFVLMQIAVILLIPVVFKQLADPRHGNLPPAAVYLAWCAAGLLPVLGTLLHRVPVRYQRIYVDHRPVRWIAPLYVVVPFVSLLVHLYSAAWVYSVDFEWAYISPVLLGLAVAVAIVTPRPLPARLATRVQVAMTLASIYLAAGFPDSLVIDAAGGPEMLLSPLRVALAGGTLLCLWLFWRQRRPILLAGAAVAGAACLLGHSVVAIQWNLERLGRWCFATGAEMVPRTSMQWGIVAVTASFLFLALGALFSLRRKPPAAGEDPADVAVIVQPAV